MSYQLKDVVRLHGRDLIFATRYWQDKLVNQLQGNPDKSLVLCNSYPKSGTHLLYQILYSIPGLHKWDDIVSVQALCGVMNTVDHIRWKVGSAPNHAIVRSHLMYCDEIFKILKDFNCKTLFIYRDLRDVAVSHARWVTNEERIFLHNFYIAEDTFDQQLMYSIKGVPIGSPFSSNASQPDIGSDFRRWSGWITDPGTLSIKFEDLVGERGGGSEDKRLLRIEQILDHLSISIPTRKVKDQFASYVLNPNDSHTFQKGGKGSIGGWKTYFTENHKTEFKKVAGELLIHLGYEQDHNW
ncbi:sulfotransferase domain-containing protein [Acaryochloris marina]|uniref:sulfotransferase domain-containing protein n=1 Tax=Acaryochloris marina TaxID=155978 RepID=UPI001BAFE0AC|nr:sulfotransferase domain-containing protein [Acaryochloris marina]QUY44829.1 sulfotransferase domain-containing protein [Acaryochloris marina S15]